MNVKGDSNNKLMRRREILIELEYEGATPSRDEIKQKAASDLGLKQENIVVVSAGQQYGTHTTMVLIHEYANADAMKVAQPHILARPNKKEKKAEAAAPKAEAPKEKKAEAHKEEKKTEQKAADAK